MRVKIISCSYEEWWHEKYIGSEVEVKEWSYDAYFALDVEEAGGVLPKKDCIVVKGDNKMDCVNRDFYGKALAMSIMGSAEVREELTITSDKSSYGLKEVISILDSNPNLEFEAVVKGGRRYEAKLLKDDLYVTTEGLSDCMIPAATIPMNLKWRLK